MLQVSGGQACLSVVFALLSSGVKSTRRNEVGLTYFIEGLAGYELEQPDNIVDGGIRPVHPCLQTGQTPGQRLLGLRHCQAGLWREAS